MHTCPRFTFISILSLAVSVGFSLSTSLSMHGAVMIECLVRMTPLTMIMNLKVSELLGKRCGWDIGLYSA